MVPVEAVGLVKAYPRARALDGLTLALPGGGAVGLLGRNGAGKSTFLKILLGFLRPDAGQARVFGLDPARAPLEVRRHLGYMPEAESFIPGATAVDTVCLAARLSGLPRIDALQRAHRVLGYVGLREERYRDVAGYSSGMKQKVKLAQAVVHHPKLLLLDEPTAGLDPMAREEMLALIRDLAVGKGIDVLLSTHILSDVEAVCARVAVLHRGRLVLEEDLRKMTAGPDGAYEIRVKGDRDAYLKALKAEGLTGEPEGDDGVRAASPRVGSAPLLRAAVASGVQVCELSRRRGTLEERFAELVKEA
ncbi:MAG TPA: ABC transporter ATP-binding protein [Planctomycetota bacterium]